MSHDLNGKPARDEFTAENLRLREEVAQLQRELRGLKQLEEDVLRLEKEKAEIAAERDGYIKSILYLTREEWSVTQGEIDEADRNGVRFDEKFLEDLERDLRSMGPADAKAS